MDTIDIILICCTVILGWTGLFSIMFFYLRKEKKKNKCLDCSRLKFIRNKFSYKPHPLFENKYIIFDESNKTAHIAGYYFSELLPTLIRYSYGTASDVSVRLEDKKKFRTQRKIYNRYKNGTTGSI